MEPQKASMRLPSGDATSEQAPKAEPKLELTSSRQFTAWLAEHCVSIAFTTYQTGKLFLIGLQPSGRLSVFERTFNRCMGLWADAQTLWMSSLYQLWRFENTLQPGQTANGYDRFYVPQVGYTTGDIDIHDVAVGQDGQAIFVNTLFSCLAATSERYSFAPLWKPPFITKLAAEDRCHLNGLAMDHGRPRYVTSVSRSDVADGWRDRRRDGGCVIDVSSDRLWLVDSGSGFFGRADVAGGKFEPMTFCLGYLRGLAFVGDFAVVGLSKPRENRTFTGLALDENLAARDAEARCGLYVIDLRTGDTVHWLRIEGIVAELYDVVVLPGVIRPMALGFKSDEIRRTLSVGDESCLFPKGSQP